MGQGHVKVCLLVLSIKKMATVKRVVISVSSCAIYNKPKSEVITIFLKIGRFYVISNTIKLCNIFLREFSFESSKEIQSGHYNKVIIIFKHHRRRKLLISGLNDLCNGNCIEATFINNFISLIIATITIY